MNGSVCKFDDPELVRRLILRQFSSSSTIPGLFLKLITKIACIEKEMIEARTGRRGKPLQAQGSQQ